MSYCRTKSLFLVAALLCAGVSVQASIGAFDRYQLILDRQPFGSAPVDVSSATGSLETLAPTGPSFVDKLQLCSISVRGSRVRVGFVDNNQKPAATYLLYVGESSGGYEVLDANYEAEWVKLRKDSQERVLSMSGADSAGALAATGPAGPSVGPVHPFSRSRSRRIPRVGPVPNLTKEEYKRQRAAGLRPVSPSPRSILNGTLPPASIHTAPGQFPENSAAGAAATKTEWEQKMRAYNMDIIRSDGALGPALPIELTPEEDEQLVSEGHLPPPPSTALPAER